MSRRDSTRRKVGFDDPLHLQFGRKAEVEVAIRTAIRQVFVDTRNHRAGNRQSRHGTQQLRDKGTICRRAVGHFYLFFFFKGGVGNVGSSDAPDPLSGYLVYVLFFRFRVVSPSPNSAIPKRDLWSSVRNPYLPHLWPEILPPCGRQNDIVLSFRAYARNLMLLPLCLRFFTSLALRSE